jgi:hypothetical protein
MKTRELTAEEIKILRDRVPRYGLVDQPSPCFKISSAANEKRANFSYPTDMVSRQELSKLLGISEGTLKRWVHQKVGPRWHAPFYESGLKYYRGSEIESWLLSDAPKFACSKRKRKKLLELRIKLACEGVQQAKALLSELNSMTKEQPSEHSGFEERLDG